MFRKSFWLATAALGAFGVFGCSDDTGTTPQDGAVDMAQKDATVTEAAVKDAGAKEAAAKDVGSKEAAIKDAAKLEAAVADAAKPDFAVADAKQPDAKQADAKTVADQSKPDVVPWAPDQSPSQGPGVLYVTGSSSTALSAYRIKSNGSGKKMDTTLPASFYIYSMYKVGRKEFAAVNRDQPTRLAHITSYYQPIHLPNNLGHVYMYRTTTPAGYGFFAARPNGKVDKLAWKASSSGTSTSTTYNYYYYVGFNKLGTLMAAAYAYSQPTAAVHMIRTDGKKWASSGTAVCDVTPTSPKVSYIRYYSFTFADKYLYFVARDATVTTQYYLLRAPIDCSAKATQVKLPTVGGSAVKTIDYYFGLSEDQKNVFLVAGSSSTSEDIMVVDDASGSVRNVSASPAQYYGPGYYHMYYSTTGTMVDLSPDNKHVAYIKYSGGSYPLYVRPVDKSKKAVLVTNSANFTSAAKYTRALVWVNNDDLRFWVGNSTSYMDMFKYQPSTGKVTQITTSGGTTKPYAGGATLRPYGGWFSPNGKYLYYMEYSLKSGSPTQSNIRGIERATGKLIDITKNKYVYYSTSNIEAAATGGKVFFYSYKAGATSPYAEDVFYFDQNAGTAAVKLTSHTPGTSSFYVYDIMPNKDGSKVAYRGGVSSKYSPYVVEVGATPKVYQLTATPTATTYLSDHMIYSADGKSLVYGSGTLTSKLNLSIQTIGTGTKPTVLEATGGYTSPLMVYP